MKKQKPLQFAQDDFSVCKQCGKSHGKSGSSVCLKSLFVFWFRSLVGPLTLFGIFVGVVYVVWAATTITVNVAPNSTTAGTSVTVSGHVDDGGSPVINQTMNIGVEGDLHVEQNWTHSNTWSYLYRKIRPHETTTTAVGRSTTCSIRNSNWTHAEDLNDTYIDHTNHVALVLQRERTNCDSGSGQTGSALRVYDLFTGAQVFSQTLRLSNHANFTAATTAYPGKVGTLSVNELTMEATATYDDTTVVTVTYNPTAGGILTDTDGLGDYTTSFPAPPGNGSYSVVVYTDYFGNVIKSSSPLAVGGTTTCPSSGNNVTIASSCEFAAGTYTFTGTLTIAQGVTVFVGDTVAPGQVVLNSDNINVQGNINADGLGYAAQTGAGAGSSGNYAGGGGHGGAGGAGFTSAPGGTTNDSSIAPVLPGSGGGDDLNWAGQQGGAGGGAIKLNAPSGTVTIAGVVSANGANASGNDAGAGAGGSVWVEADTLAGTGSIAANGGAGYDVFGGGGGGGGGRIAVGYVNGSPTSWTQTASGGAGGSGGAQPGSPGADGTVVASFANGCTPAGNNVTISADCTYLPGAYTYTGTLTIGSGAEITIGTDANRGHVTINSDNIIVDGIITASGLGGLNEQGTGAGNNDTNTATASGGGYGGAGGDSSTNPGGVVYGSLTQPIDLGSGGGDDLVITKPGGSGGGAIKLVASGTLAVSGTVEADGEDGQIEDAGGGSGGSLWISANTVAITGTVSANGGNGLTGRTGGAGGGGRIAIYYTGGTPSSWNITAYGGEQGSGGSNQDGGAGTIYLKQSTETNGDLIIANNETNNAAYTPQREATNTFNNVTLAGGAIYYLSSGKTLNVPNAGTLGGSWTTNAPQVRLDSGAMLNPNQTTWTVNGTDIFNAGTIAGVVSLTMQNGMFELRDTGSFPAGLANVTVGNLGGFDTSGTSTLSLTSLTVQNGGTVSHQANADTHAHELDISATTVTIDTGGKIDVTGKGFASGKGTGGMTSISRGGGYGGDGGYDPAGVTYGSPTNPVDLGSGGGASAGGGAVFLNVSGTLTLNGDIIADGEYHTSYSTGSGGTVNITAATIAGTGSISAAGGDSASINGVGGGGRVAVVYTNGDPSDWGMSASGGINSSTTALRMGGAGTIFTRQSAETYGDLFVQNNDSDYGNTTTWTGTASQTYANITIADGTDIVIPSGYSLNLDTSGVVTFSGTAGQSLKVASGGTIDLDAGSMTTSHTTGVDIASGGAMYWPAANYILDNTTFVNAGTFSGATGLAFTNSTISLYDTATLGATPVDLTIGSGSTLTQYGKNAITVGDLTVESGGTLTHATNGTSENNFLNLSADNVDLQVGGVINVTTRGYTSKTGPGAGSGSGCTGWGAAHGGEGNNRTAQPYDSITQPSQLGSGGGGASVSCATGGGVGGTGGGLVKLVSSGNVALDGDIYSNGGSGSGNGYSGGSGGSVWIDAGTLSGSGNVTVNGGNGRVGTRPGGGGAGGRVAIEFDTGTTSSMNLESFGGSGDSGYGGPGTIFTKIGASNGALTVDNNGNGTNARAGHLLPASYAYDTLAMSGLAKLRVMSGSNFELSSSSILDMTGSGLLLDIDSGSTLTLSATYTVDGLDVDLNGTAATIEDLTVQNGTFLVGSTGSFSPGLTDLTVGNAGIYEHGGSATWSIDTITVQNGGQLSHNTNTSSKANWLDINATTVTVDAGGEINLDGKGYAVNQGPGASTGGGGHGGNGGAGGASNGSVTAPIDLGSGGGTTAGGGALKIVATNLTLNGLISADGPDTSGAGGAGGSVFLDVDNWLGTGTISTNGGSSSSTNAGGGGGRISIINWLSGDPTVLGMQAYGGSNTVTTVERQGGAGTIYLNENTSTLNGDLIVRNNNIGYANWTTQVTPSHQTYDNITIADGSRYRLLNGQTLELASGGTFTTSGTAKNGLDVQSGATLNLGGSTLSLNGTDLIHSGTLTGVSTLEVINADYTYDTDNTTGFGSTPGITIGTGGTVTLTNDSTFTVSNLVVQSGGVLTHANNSTTKVHAVDISATNIDIQSGGKVDVSELGFDGSYGLGAGPANGNAGNGGGYGGNGGSAGGASYGNPSQPTDLGSGGGRDTSDPSDAAGATVKYGGPGGGAVKLVASGNFTLNGEIISKGGSPPNGYDDSDYPGAGSGGSVWVSGASVYGTGSISVNGSDEPTTAGGPGGAGRVAVYWGGGTANPKTDWSITAFGGHDAATTNGGHGGAGSIYYKGPTSTYGDLVILNNTNYGTATTQNSGLDEIYDNVTIGNGAWYEIESGSFAMASGGTFSVSGANKSTVNIAAGTSFNLGQATVTIDNLNIVNNGQFSTVTDLTITNGTFENNGTFPAGLHNLVIGAGGHFIHDSANTLFSGSDMTILNGGTFTQVGTDAINVTNLTVESGGTLTHADNSSTKANQINFNSTNIDIQAGAIVNADDLGYDNKLGPGGGGDHANGGSGGGHGAVGGLGGNGSLAGGVAYDSVIQPIEMGSGGGNDSYCNINPTTSAGGSGGGVVKLVATNLTLNSTISADGGLSAYTGDGCHNAGQGAGGSVWIEAGTLAGSGGISADGGGLITAGNAPGAGGRVAIHWTNGSDPRNDWTVSAEGGVSFATTARRHGGAGSVYYSKGGSSGDLVIKNGSLYGNYTPQIITAVQSYNNVSIDGGAYYVLPDGFDIAAGNLFDVGTNGIFEIQHDDGLNMSGHFRVGPNGTVQHSANGAIKTTNIDITAGQITVESSGLISSFGRGFTSGNGTGAGGSVAAGGAGGAGFGGQGGTGTGVGGTAGIEYGIGLELSPTDLGSGGGKVGATDGAAGGGQIRLDVGVTGTTTINGTLDAGGASAVNANTGGGSGGSIYLISGTFTGNGTISSGGGSGQGNAGCGAGGRVATSYETSTYTGTMVAPGACAYSDARDGNDGTVNSVQNAPNITSVTHLPASPLAHQTITVTATATDNVGVKKIELYLDGTAAGDLFKTCNFSPVESPASCPGDIGPYTVGGSHTVTAVAYDDFNNTAADTDNINVNNPVASITALTPTQIGAGGGAFTLTVNGSNFVNTSVVRWNGLDRVTTWVDEGTITAAILAADVGTVGTFPVTVHNPAPGGGTSTGENFIVVLPPTIDQMTHLPNTATVLDDVTLRGVASDDVGLVKIQLYLDDATLIAPVHTCNYSNTTPGTCDFDTGTLAVGAHRLDVVATDTQAASTQGTYNFTINNPLPVLNNLDPNVATLYGLPFTLTINGSNFIPDPDGAGALKGSVVTWNGADQVTTFVNSNRLTIEVTSFMLQTAGSKIVTVVNTAPGGGTSAPQTFTVASGGGGGGGIPIPNPPTATRGEAISFNTIRWYFTDNATSEIGFRILDQGNNGRVVAEKAQASLTYLDETGLAPDTLYCHRSVVAYNGSGVSTIGSTQSYDCLRTLMEAPIVAPVPDTPFNLLWTTSRSVILGWEESYMTEFADQLFAVKVFETNQWATPDGAGGIVLGSNPTYLSIEDWGAELDIFGFIPSSDYGIWLHRKEVGQFDSQARIVWQQTMATQEERAMAYVGRTATTASLQWSDDFFEAHDEKVYALHDLTFNRYVGPEAGGGAEYIMVHDAYYQSLEDWGALLTVLDLQPETEYVIDIIEKDPGAPDSSSSVIWTVTVTTEEQSVVRVTGVDTREASLAWNEEFAVENSDSFFAFYETTTGQWLVPDTVSAAGLYSMAALFEGEAGTEEDLVKLRMGEHPYSGSISDYGINMYVGALTPATPYELQVLRFENLFDSGLGSKQYYPQIVWILTMETEEEYVEFLVNKQLLGWDIESSFDEFGEPQSNFVYLYDIYIENIGSYNAEEVILIDPIPSIATYRRGTITSDGVPQTDAVDEDYGHYYGEHPDTLREEVRWFWDNLGPNEYHEVQLRLDVPVFEMIDIEYYNATISATCGAGHPNAGGDCSDDVSVGHDWTDFGLITKKEFDDPNTGVHWSVDYLPVTPNFTIINGGEYPLTSVRVITKQNIGYPYVSNTIRVDGALQTDAQDGDRGRFLPASAGLQRPAMAVGWPTMAAITQDSQVIFEWPSLAVGEEHAFSYSADYINFDGREAPPDIQNEYQKIFCGDGFVDPGEQCDDGVMNGTLGYCTLQCDYCGNSVTEPQFGESCDDGANNGLEGFCPSTCRYCGNDKLEEGEECDRGDRNGVQCNAPGKDACEWCTNMCLLNENVCGNATIEIGEECDWGTKGKKRNGTVCVPEIGKTCTYCNNSCSISWVTCGNGRVDEGEQCDRGGANGSICVPPEGGGTCEYCTSSCEIAINPCGDGVKDSGEQCDFGAQNGIECAVDEPGASCSWCTRFCELDTNSCGDMILDEGEICDWGDKRPRTTHYNGAGCTPEPGEEYCTYCTTSCTADFGYCGNGILDTDYDETCDEGSLNGAICTPPAGGGTCDYCGHDCHVAMNLCGNAVVDSGAEQCDLGAQNTVECAVEVSEENTDGDCSWCTLWCQIDINRCGDGELDEGEQCDRGDKRPRAQDYNGKMCVAEPGMESCTWCTLECTEAYGFCGNGILEPEHDELCDEGSENGRMCEPPIGGGTCEYCTAGCQPAINPCGNGIVEGNETCDLGAFNGQECSVEITPDNPSGLCHYCTRYCTTNYFECGDGILTPHEQCDYGSNKKSKVRNGKECVPSPGEESCTMCTEQCELDYRYCGNGILNPGEQCDWGAENGAVCQPEIGSTCTYCGTDCMLTENLCGNSVIDSDESCDEGPNNNKKCEVRVEFGDPNPPTCTWCNQWCEEQTSRCGDGTLDPGEWCDWGENTKSKKKNGSVCTPALGDYCEYCQVGCFLEKNYCGNGMLEPDKNEACDNGQFNGVPCKPGVGFGCGYCSDTCQPVEMEPLSIPDLFIINLRAMDWLPREDTEYIVEPPPDEDDIIICEDGDVECEENKEIIICEDGDVECEEEKRRQEDEDNRRDDDEFDTIVPIPSDTIRSTDKTPVIVIQTASGTKIYIFVDGKFWTSVVADVNGMIRLRVTDPLVIGSHIFSAFKTPVLIAGSDEAAAVGLGLVGINLAFAVGARGLLNILWALFTQPALLFGRKRKKLYGTVFNSLTRQPIDLATVRLFSASSGRPVAARVTDSEGRYLLKARSGEYLMDVKKLGYVFPTQFISTTEDVVYPDLLIGDQFTHKDDGLVSKNLPVDPQDVERTPTKVYLSVIANHFKHAVALSGPAISVFAFIMYPSITMAAILVIHALLYWLFRKFGYIKAPKKYGVVTDMMTNKPVSKAIIRIFDKKYNKLLETQITDARGRYAFLVGQNTYYVTADKPGYESYRSGDLVREKSDEETYIVEDFKLKPDVNAVMPPSGSNKKPPKNGGLLVGPDAPIAPISPIPVKPDTPAPATKADAPIPFEIAAAQQNLPDKKEKPADGIHVMPGMEEDTDGGKQKKD